MSDTYTSTKTMSVEFALPDAGSVAANAIPNALAFCAKKLHLNDIETVEELLRQGDGAARGYFEYGLARELAEHVGALDDEVQAVYLYDPEAASEDAVFGRPMPTMVHLVVWARRKTGALSSLLAALDQSVSQRYAEMLDASDQMHLLDVQVVDDAAVNARNGFGAMLAWLHNRPLMVWKR